MSLATFGWIIVLCLLLLPIYAVYAENSEIKISRGHYLNWFLAYISAMYLLPLFVAPTNFGGLFAVGVIAIIVYYFFMQKTVQRCRDAGVPKKDSYYALIPVLGFVVIIALLFKDSLHEDNNPIERT